MSGHGSSPENCKNPLPGAARIYMKVFEYVTEYQTNVCDNLRFSFTKINGGTTFNVIPDICTIAGTLRTFDDEHSTAINKRIGEIIKEVCEEDGLEFDYGFHLGADGAVVNTPECAQFVRRVAQKQYGEDCVSDDGLPVYASEDFADFLTIAPGAFFFRVVNHLPPHVTLHHNEYNFDDSVIEDLSLFWWNLVFERCIEK